MTIDITEIVVALIGLLSTIATVFVIPLIKSKMTDAQWEKLRQLINIGVSAAEQLSNNGTISKGERKDYVLNSIKSSGILEAMKRWGLTIDINAVSDMIEAAVYDLPQKLNNKEVKKLTEQKVEVIAAAAVEAKADNKIAEVVSAALPDIVSDKVEETVQAKVEEKVEQKVQDVVDTKVQQTVESRVDEKIAEVVTQMGAAGLAAPIADAPAAVPTVTDTPAEDAVPSEDDSVVSEKVMTDPPQYEHRYMGDEPLAPVSGKTYPDGMIDDSETKTVNEAPEPDKDSEVDDGPTELGEPVESEDDPD